MNKINNQNSQLEMTGEKLSLENAWWIKLIENVSLKIPNKKMPDINAWQKNLSSFLEEKYPIKISDKKLHN